MKRYLLAVFCALCGSASAGTPHLVCTDTAFDFGTVASTQMVTRAFILKNDGDAPLVIEKVRSSCGCTTTTLSDKITPPGSNCTVTVTMTMKARSGAQHKALYVHSNDPTQPILQIRMTGTIIPVSTNKPPSDVPVVAK
jgi:hypothetical protein